MIIKLTNGRKFIIKNEYNTIDKMTHKKDEFDRDVYTCWEERECLVHIYEFYKHQPLQKVTVIGRSHCSYQDKFDKAVARNLAYYRAVEQLMKLNLITAAEADEFMQFELNQCVFKCEPMNTAKYDCLVSE